MTEPPTTRARRRADPLWAMAAIAAALFGADTLLRDESTRDDRIQIGAAFVRALAADHERRLGRPITAPELAASVERAIDDELLVRRARALRIDEGDPIVRRRLAQKLTYALEALAPSGPATEAELTAARRADPARYERAPGRRVEQIFFGAEDAPGALARAERALALARAGVPVHAELARPLPIARALGAKRDTELEALLGRPLLDALDAAETGAWVGPVASRYGIHIARQLERWERGEAPDQAVRARLETDALRARREAHLRRELDALRREVSIEIEWPPELESAP